MRIVFAIRYFYKEDIIIKPNRSRETQVNHQIRDREIRVIGADGSQLGIMNPRDAVKIAKEQGLDLVKIAPKANPPVCKIIDYGKFLFNKKKREKKESKKQTFIEVKEVWLSATIEENDMNTKARQTLKFLDKGFRVKVGLRMRGRQMQHTDIAFDVMNKFIEMLGDKVKIDKPAKQMGRIILTFISPNVEKK